MAKQPSIMQSIAALHKEAEAAHLRLVREDGEPVLLDRQAARLDRIDALLAEANHSAEQADARQSLMQRIAALHSQTEKQDQANPQDAELSLAEKLEEIKQAVAAASQPKAGNVRADGVPELAQLVEQKVAEIMARELPKLVRAEVLALKKAGKALSSKDPKMRTSKNRKK